MNKDTNIDDVIEWLRRASASPALYASPDREKMDQARTMIQMLRDRVDALEKAQSSSIVAVKDHHFHLRIDGAAWPMATVRRGLQCVAASEHTSAVEPAPAATLPTIAVSKVSDDCYQVHLVTPAGMFPLGTPWHGKAYADMYAEAIRQSMAGKDKP